MFRESIFAETRLRVRKSIPELEGVGEGVRGDLVSKLRN